MSRRDLAGADKLAEHLSPEEWRKHALEIFTAGMNLPTLQAIVNAGIDEFERVARPGFHGQGFKQEDLHYIFHGIRQHVATKVRDLEQGVVAPAIDPLEHRARETGVIITELNRGEVKISDG